VKADELGHQGNTIDIGIGVERTVNQRPMSLTGGEVRRITQQNGMGLKKEMTNLRVAKSPLAPK
jgi:hypothetical protein